MCMRYGFIKRIEGRTFTIRLSVSRYLHSSGCVFACLVMQAKFARRPVQVAEICGHSEWTIHLVHIL